MYPSVIMCGHNTTLLSTRKLVLEQAGFSVRTAMEIHEIQDTAGAVLVLCYTLSDIERITAIEGYRSRFPGAKVLILGGHARAFPGKWCKTLTDYSGPELFLERVSQLVRESRPN